MIRYVCAVRDSAAGVFGQPIFVPSLGVANRSFADEVNRVDANNQLNVHPEDFELFHLGEFDDVEGVLTPRKPVSLARAKDVIVNKGN